MEHTLPIGRFDDHAFLDYDRSSDLTLHEIGNFACPSLYSYGPVARPRDIFHFVISGSGRLIIRNKEHYVKECQGFLIPANERALYIADKENPWSYFWLHIGGVRLEEMWKKAGINADSPVFVSEKNAACMNDWYRLMSEGRDRELYCISKLYEIMDFIVSTSRNRQIITKDPKLDYVRKTIHIIQLKYTETLYISQIAELCGLNRSYLSRLFKDATGRSIQTYIMEYRMKKAIQLLKETNDSVQNISTLVGYNDIYTFSKAFKKMYGVSPSKFRQP